MFALRIVKKEAKPVNFGEISIQISDCTPYLSGTHQDQSQSQ